MENLNSDINNSEADLQTHRNYFRREESKQKLASNAENFESKFKSTYNENNMFGGESSFDQSDESESENDDKSYSTFFVPKILLNIWKQTSDYSKLYYLWVESFSIKQKIALWNSLDISIEFFKNCKELLQSSLHYEELVNNSDKEESEYNYYILISSLKENELDTFISYFIFGNANSQHHKKKHYESKEKYFEYLFQSSIDSELEGTISNIIFEKYFKISEQKALNNRNCLIEMRLAEFAEDSKEIKDYIVFLQNSQNTMEKNKHIILRKVKHLYRDMLEERNGKEK